MKVMAILLSWVDRQLVEQVPPASKLLSNRFRTDAPEQSLAQPAMGPHVGIHRNLEPLYTIPKPRLG